MRFYHSKRKSYSQPLPLRFGSETPVQFRPHFENAPVRQVLNQLVQGMDNVVVAEDSLRIIVAASSSDEFLSTMLKLHLVLKGANIHETVSLGCSFC